MTSAVRFRTITVTKMPGFPTGGPGVDDLSPGINIIFGPNGAGKTTLARAIRGLFWPDTLKDKGAVISATASEDGTELTFELIGNSPNTLPHRPKIPPDDAGGRYCITLGDLLAAESDTGFASLVREEIYGGLNLPQALTELGAKPKITKPPNRTRYDRAADQLSQAVQSVRVTVGNEQKLLEAQAEQKHLSASVDRLEHLKSAGRIAELKRDLQEKESLLTTFTERYSGIDRLREDDRERTISLQKKAESLRENLAILRTKIETVERELKQAGVSEDRLAPEIDEKLTTLRARISDLRVKEQETESAEQNRRDAVDKLEHAAKGVVIDRAAELDDEALRELESLAAEEQEITALERSCAGARGIYGSEKPGDQDALIEGMLLLENWIGAGHGIREEHTVSKIVLIVIAIAAGVEAVILAQGGSPLWYTLLLLPLLALIVVYKMAAGRKVDRRPEIQDAYSRLDLPSPEQWSEEPVRETLDELQKRRAEARVADLASEKIAALREKEAEAAQRRENLENRKQKFAAASGIDPALSSLSLQHAAEAIRKHRDAGNAAEQAERRQKRLAAECEALRKDVRDELTALGIAAADAARGSDLESLCLNFKLRLDRFQKASREQKTYLEDQRRLTETLEENHRIRSGILARLGLNSEEEYKVGEWSRELPQYLELKRKIDENKFVIDNLTKTSPEAEGLAEKSADEIAIEIAERSHDRERLDEIIEEIGKLKKEIESGKQRRRIEEATRERDEALEDLATDRNSTCSSMVLNLLGEHLRSTVEKNSSNVLEKARRHLAKFTNGEFLLEFRESAKGDADFFARDTSRNAVRGLTELSDGTKAQLLMAVRTAFLEEKEGADAKLPLVMDETLANSDEKRSTAIIEAAYEVCAAGRQIFYLTARHSEVQKWLEVARDKGIAAPAVIDLEERRRLRAEEIFGKAEIPARPAVPTPGTMSRNDYARTLGVPAIDRFTAEPGSLHLVYLTDDLDFIHRQLSRGISTWGQLDALSDSVPEQSTETIEQVRASARAFSTALELWRRGRGRELTPADIQTGFAGNDGFTKPQIQDADNLVKRCSGDAKLFIQTADETKAIKRLTDEKRDALKQWLKDGGWLSEEEQVPPETALERLLTALRPELNRGAIETSRLKEIVDLIWR